MGYIPPVYYDQRSVYANREPNLMPMIQRPSEVERIQFYQALKDGSKPQSQLHFSFQKKQQVQQAKIIENILTERGEIFDKSV